MIKRRTTAWNVWFGVRYRIHPLFSIVLLLSVLTGYFIEIVTLFGIVLIHELGHVAAAKAFGWRVTEVQLLPFGGVAVVEEMGGVSVWEDIAVALAGPLQNVWMMLVGWVLTATGILPAEWGHYFIQANLLIALFNLMPVLPLDGGKVMRALLSLWLPYQRTIHLAALTSLILSAAFIVMSALHVMTAKGGIQLNWLMIGIFLLFSNWYEFRGLPYHFMRFLLNREAGLKRSWTEGTLARPIVVGGRRQVADIVRLFMRDRYHLVYVLDDRGSIRHVVPERALLQLYFNETKRSLPLSDLFAG
ncbi:Stage IV sporulation protein FB [Paenibacillus solanacearum]|uniref:Stage IV sporulation protein FB n=1 Tax=Paenibacillus solanacearum TaxID=2048548 RepID=A0A916NXQ1_9BACL|nr:M50 family metallopeptidase [Paenibacillus solanacearum]CAG7631173.1 Stage IV sporulation protein FB [Paenibacillus solanacearum]